MKNLLIICFCVIPCFLLAQRFHDSVVEYVSAEGITYELDKTDVGYIFSNIANYRMNAPYVKLDGSPAGGTWEDYDAGKLDKDAVKRVIREVFTAQEIADVKSTNTSLGLSCIYDNRGILVEVSFNLNRPSSKILAYCPDCTARKTA